MAKRFDAIVVGGGPNGLAAAARLAKRGRAVLLLEARATLGGLSGRIDFHPGYAAPGVLHDDGRLSDFAATALDLRTHGLVFRDAPPVLVTEPEGPGLLLDRDERTTAALLAERSPRDGESWLAYRAFFRRIAPFVRSLMTSPPPPLSPASIGDWVGLSSWRGSRRCASPTTSTSASRSRRWSRGSPDRRSPAPGRAPGRRARPRS